METKATVLAAAAVIATGVLAYAVYFDYKRRNDADFRRKLRKEKKRVNKSVAQSKQSDAAADAVNANMLKEALEMLKSEPPVPLEEREQYFMTQVGMGEQLASQGPAFYVPAAIAFFRALRIYPAPSELIGIYEKTVVPPVFKLVIDMTNMDVSARVTGFYDVFPPKSMNVSIVNQESPTMKGARQVLVASKDFAAGETIYKEFPVVTALDPDLQTAGTHCTHCFRVIQSGMSIQSEEGSSVLPAAYCSKVCLLASKTQSHGILFTLENPLPKELLAGPMPEPIQAERKEAQTAFMEYVKNEKRNVPLLAARFIARQIVAETSRLVAATNPAKKAAPAEQGNDFADADSGDYQLADHVERWRYLECTPPEQELPLLSNLLKSTLPGLEQFTTPERHATMIGKIMYNSFGVCFSGGRDDKPKSEARPEDVEKSRTPYGTERQIGSALYTVSSYLTHSCKPSARPSFSSGTTELHLIANRDLKKGDVLTVAFVDVTQHPDESVLECRRRRRIELARGWRFACGCERCEEEAKEIPVEQKEARDEEGKDESKVEQSVKNLQENPARAHESAASPIQLDIE